MSSKSPTLQPLSDIPAKKKFGTNLNKQLSKPPPPISGKPKANSTSRNGLLLLSTKRTSSSAPSPSAGGILSTKSVTATGTKSMPSLGLQNKSSTSTHDVLLGAVVGASRAELPEPDAWGVADKGKDLIASTDVGVPTTVAKKEPQAENNDKSDDPQTEQTSSLPVATWDEYGGRDVAPNPKSELFSPTADSVVDSQKIEMLKMAKKRAEAKRAEEEKRQRGQRERAEQRLRDLEKKSSVVKPRTLFDPNQSNIKSSKDERCIDVYSNVSNVSNSANVDSYSREPIQLSSFDGKARMEKASSVAPRMLYDPKSGSMVAVTSKDEAGQTRGRKEKNKKGKASRDKDCKDSKQDIDTKRKGKRDKKPNNDNAKNVARKDGKKGQPPAESRLPRTRGVLYNRDAKGNLVSVDGCDGDLGYGAHSVPGGRVKNSDAFSKGMDKKKISRGFDTSRASETMIANQTFAAAAGMQLDTGLNVNPLPQVDFEWIKPDDKIELITGVEGSPTLQATAKEWAPSHGVLTSGVGNFENGSSFDEAEDGSKDDDGPFGLGFDPTLNMDSMMQSPAMDPSSGLDGVDLPSLSLEPTFAGPTNNNHIFAFGAGSTWGSSDTGGQTDSWAAPTTSSNAATSFLNLSSEKPWGATTAFGALNRDNGRSTGD